MSRSIVVCLPFKKKNHMNFRIWSWIFTILLLWTRSITKPR